MSNLWSRIQFRDSVQGALVLVIGIYPDEHVLHLAIPANNKGDESWQFAAVCSCSTHLHWYC